MNPFLHLYLFHLHVFFSILGLFGVFLAYHWVKQLPPAAQRNVALWCLILGGIGILITVPFCLIGMRLMMPVM